MPHIETTTIEAVSLALDAASLRHQAIASNIANANTPNYRPARVSFEERLGTVRAALKGGHGVDPKMLAGSHARIELEPAATPGAAAPQVAIDEQVAKLSENAVHYQALLRALNKQFAILGMAINEGKR